MVSALQHVKIHIQATTAKEQEETKTKSFELLFNQQLILQTFPQPADTIFEFDVFGLIQPPKNVESLQNMAGQVNLRASKCIHYQLAT